MTLAEREALALSIGQPGIFALKTAQKRWDRLLEKVRESLAAKMSQTEGKPEIDTAKDQATNSDAQTRQKGPEQAADIDSRALAAAIAPQATELDLRAKSHEVERDGDVGVVMGSGDVRFVSLAEAAAATRSEIDGGTPATPFQIHNATGIRIGDAQRAIDAANKTKASEIADFGEKLGGARKDRDAMRAAFDKVPTDAEIEHLPLSKLWPASETDKIEDPFTAAVMFASRAEIPAKPRKGYKVRAWAEKVKLFRGVVQRALGDVTREQFLAEMRSHRALDGFRAKLALLEAIDRQHWKRIGEVNEYPDAYRFGEDGEKIRSSFVSVTIDGRAEHFSGVGSVADALDAVRERLGDGPAESRLQFDVYSKGGAYFIAKAGDKEKRALRRFPSAKEAMEYRKSNHDDLVAAWEAVKDRDNVKKTDVRRGENRERVGHDWRGGKDVTPEQFIEELGFRGVEFGNWVEQGKGAKERQGMLNQAYDALRDLADVVGIPPRAVSLDGTLGLGFGSRGSGRASAHFESDTLVINLTKTRGAGSLAHEWFHALDNYFARYRGVPTFKGNQAQYRREAFITYNPESFYTHKTTGTILPQRAFEVMIKGERHPEHGRLSSRAMDRAQWELKEGVRPEVGEAFSGVVKALDESPMAQRSALNDKGATDGYWSRIIERAARAFEGYAIHKMAQRGHQNDYLANVVPAADFVRDAGRYPYMLESEMAPVAEAFDALFATIQTRRTDRGEALFSFAGRDAETADLHGLGNAQRRIAAGENPEAVRQATGWHRGADGMWRFEISDEQARLAVGGKTAAEVLDAASLDGPNVRVADMLDHPQLFAAYPHLENIRVELMPAGERAAARLMRSVTGTRLQIRGSLKSETLPSVMLHELQHAIQNAEGFATGGSARNLTSDLDRSGAETYRRLAGEVEARNTQSRMRMTDAMRRQVSPELTADVPSDEVIVTFNGQVLSTAPKNTGSRLPVSERGLLRALRYQFPGLVEPTRRMLERGRAGTKGGLVVIDSADPLRVAGTFSMKTGRALDDSIELFSEAATVNGFFDPRSGLIFLVGPNLDPITAPAVLLHEMIHGQQREKIDAQAMAMLMNRSQEKDASTRAFLDRVAQRMVDAGAAADSKEAAAYIVEQAVIEGRSRGYRVADSKFLDWVGVTLGPRVAEFVRSVAAMVRTWMIRHGGITTLTVDDLVGYAMAGVERAASGRAGAGRNAVPATSIGPDGMAGAIRAVIDAARSPGHAPQKANLGGVADWLADEAKARAGLNIAGFTHVLDGSAVRHMLNRHTNPTIEKNRGQIPLTDADIAAAAEVIAEPDQVVLGTKTQGRKDQIAYLKRQADGSILYLEEVRSGRRELAAVSMRKYPAAKDFSDIVATLPSNARSDGGDGLIVVSPPGGGNIQFSRAGVTSQQIARNIGDGLKSITVQNIRQAGRHKLTDWLKLGLQFLGRRQLVEVYGDVLPLAHYDRLAAQMEADKNDVGATADDLARRWGKLPDEQRLAELMHDATLAQVDADSAVPYVAGDDRMRSTMLKGQFKALSADAQKVYREARDHYRRHHAEVRDAIRDRIGRSELKNERKAEILKRMDDDFFKAVKGVYFPLARFGQYVVVVKDAAGKVESVSRAETMLEAEAMRREMVKAFPARDGYRVGRVVLSKEFVASRDMVGRGFMTELYEALDQQNLPAAQLAELEDTLGQLYLSSLPDLSWAKHGIHRKGTPGFSQDARRAFAQNTFHGARYLAKLRYGDQMQTELDRMQKHVDEMSSADGFDQPGAQRVVDEMNKRHDAMMNPKSNPLSTALTSLGFVYYLGLSPAAAAVNLSQTALVAYPVMGAKWGFKKAGAALLKASGETLAGKNDMRSQLTDADEIRAYDEAVRTGTIDVTMAHDLAGIAQGEDAKVMWKIRPVMRMASFLFHHAERFNRQATFIAAYRLAKEAGSHHDSAYEQAVKATYDGHFDYSAGNRPRVMQGNVARVVLLFKQYAQNMIFTLARNAYQSVAGESDEVKREARKVFGALLTTHAAAAGVLGLPFVGTLLTMASAIGGSDDEPWDAEAALRNMLAETFGPTVSEVISKGFSRLTPWDISGRVGLNNLLLPDVQESLEGQRWAESFATAMLGPVIGMGANAAKGAQKMADGDYGRGLEDMLPIFMRNPIKAYRLWDEGAIDRSGIAIKDEVSTAGALGQLAGFSPSEVRLAFEGRSAVFRADRRLAERRAELMSGFARAAMDKDAEAMAQARDAIAAFNQANPGRRITAPQMWQSVRARQRRIDQAQDGVYLPRNRRDALEAGRFANP
ncbi:hypothetical protein DNK49_19170 [Azoarcus communis]|uniref:Large polyvalent protein-associated domain-containing protein n=2 Tax=Parazoarcus communis TaxID=41977 RepID=A0A323URW8_9RHOO|nr:PLxRFG domain-containing protein [Parazoarcus communis SWub3 = DSM 12120]PZA14991.1 hypothetical protein DNK49_19170 [Azoarcus communis] [Parazoarcus communis SWub3 = DSM 12120]